MSPSTITKVYNSTASAFTALWEGNNKDSGQQLRYSTRADMSKATTVSVEEMKYRKKVSGLSKGKTYYIQVRNYKKKDGVKYYSSWSTIESVKITK